MHGLDCGWTFSFGKIKSTKTATLILGSALPCNDASPLLLWPLNRLCSVTHTYWLQINTLTDCKQTAVTANSYFERLLHDPSHCMQYLTVYHSTFTLQLAMAFSTKYPTQFVPYAWESGKSVTSLKIGQETHEILNPLVPKSGETTPKPCPNLNYVSINRWFFVFLLFCNLDILIIIKF